MGVASPYAFTGRRFDDETGLYYYRNRYYAWHLGRFVSRDPIHYYGSYNLYEYALSSPVGRVDPTGLKSIILIFFWCQLPENLQHNYFCEEYYSELIGQNIPDEYAIKPPILDEVCRIYNNCIAKFSDPTKYEFQCENMPCPQGENPRSIIDAIGDKLGPGNWIKGNPNNVLPYHFIVYRY